MNLLPHLVVVPSPTPSATATTEAPSPIAAAEVACREGSLVCSQVAHWTGNTHLAVWVEAFTRTPLRIFLVLAGAWLIRNLVHRAINRLVRSVVEHDPSTQNVISRRISRATRLVDVNPLAAERRVQRANTMGSVLRSVVTAAVSIVAALMVLGELGLNIGPLLASAGIAGVAIGFGAQSLVKDFLSGMFMIFEDQYGVGDAVNLETVSGTVESVGLRVTRIRSVDGTVWYIPNGQITQVGNQSQGWARAVLDISVPYHENLGKVRRVMEETGRTLRDDPDWTDLIMEEPEVWGVESMTADAVVLRLVVKTKPLEQWRVARELRLRIRNAFTKAGIQVPYPHQNLIMRDERDTKDGGGAASAGAQTTGGGAPVVSSIHADPPLEDEIDDGGPTPPHGEAAVARDITPDDPAPPPTRRRH